MKKEWTENEYRTATALALWPWIAIVVIVLIGIVKGCMGNDINPLDNSVNKAREIVTHVIVVDSTHNGFRVVLASKDEITKLRKKEMQSRTSLNETCDKIKTEALLHFGSLLETNIYDFSKFLLQFKLDEDIEIHNIFVYGGEKSNFYVGPNPKIPNSANFFHFGTEQGLQYINREDIYYRSFDSLKIYRYWKCYGINALSYKDERFSHFSEDERVW
jgi:hypothetical protein